MRVVTTLGLPVVYICTCLLVANLPLQLVPYSLKNEQFSLHKSNKLLGVWDPADSWISWAFCLRKVRDIMVDVITCSGNLEKTISSHVFSPPAR